MTLAENKKKAVSFLEMASSGKVDEAYSKFIGEGFKHHNPYYDGSSEALKAGMKQNALQNPSKVFEIKRVIAEADLGVTHSHVKLKPADLGAAVVHIFRFERGRIAELWDLGQPVESNPVNQYGMF